MLRKNNKQSIDQERLMGSITEPYSIILPARCLNLPKNSIHFLVKSSWGSELNSKIQDAFGWESRHWKDWAMFRSMHYNTRRTNMGTVFISKRFPLNYLNYAPRSIQMVSSCFIICLKILILWLTKTPGNTHDCDIT